MKIQRNVYDEMIAHARREAPLEACGYCGEKEGVIRAAIALRNVDASAEHFGFDPAEQFAAVKRLRGQGLRPVVVYHSHPATPARPSAEDIRLARDPTVTYVILSLAGPEPVMKAFSIVKGRVTIIPIEVVQPEFAASNQGTTG
jgi:proteasome lid subunit RPN8/RPN11